MTLSMFYSADRMAFITGINKDKSHANGAEIKTYYM